MFLHADFNELCALVERKGPDLQDLISHIFAKGIDDDDDDDDDDSNLGSDKMYFDAKNYDGKELKKSLLDQPEPYEKIFPDLFLY
jgi:hypothetical protein